MREHQRAQYGSGNNLNITTTTLTINICGSILDNFTLGITRALTFMIMSSIRPIDFL